MVTVNRPSFELRLWKNLQLVKTYPIAVGQVGLETPAGLYHIQNKAVDPAWHDARTRPGRATSRGPSFPAAPPRTR